MTRRPDPDLTLQINLSPGDLRYAALTVPALVAAHAGEVAERLAVVDCCRPQETRMVDPDARFPGFDGNVERLRALCEGFLRDGVFDRVEYQTPGDRDFRRRLSRKYLSGLAADRQTHELGGTALTSYYAGLELTRTRFCLHYDADMLLFQRPGHSWAAEATAALRAGDRVVNAIPRRSPPPDGADGPSGRPGRPFVETDGGWLDDWFSTRCFLFDRPKVEALLPLNGGRRYLRDLFYRAVGRRFPKLPESSFFERFGPAGFRTRVSASRDCWTLHPVDKGDRFVAALPGLLPRVAAGEVPEGQAGEENLMPDAWAGPAGRVTGPTSSSSRSAR